MIFRVLVRTDPGFSSLLGELRRSKDAHWAEAVVVPIQMSFAQAGIRLGATLTRCTARA